MFHATTIVRGCKTVSAGVKGTFGILPERKKLAERALASLEKFANELELR